MPKFTNFVKNSQFLAFLLIYGRFTNFCWHLLIYMQNTLIFSICVLIFRYQLLPPVFNYYSYYETYVYIDALMCIALLCFICLLLFFFISKNNNNNNNPNEKERNENPKNLLLYDDDDNDNDENSLISWKNIKYK